MMALRLERKLGGLRRQRGFTLIELLVVIAVISILASIVYASLGSQRAKGRDGRRIAEIQSVATAMEACYDQNIVGGANSYLPGGGASPAVSGCGSSTLSAACFTSITAHLSANTGTPCTGLLPAAPRDPRGDAAHVYQGAVMAAEYIFGGNLERNNVACSSDYDVGQCADGTTPDDCDDSNPNADNIDFCIRGRQ